jgi:hypothetical protein
MDVAKIGVDSENAFGAVKLYEAVEFEHFRTNTALPALMRYSCDYRSEATPLTPSPLS